MEAKTSGEEPKWRTDYSEAEIQSYFEEPEGWNKIHLDIANYAATPTRDYWQKYPDQLRMLLNGDGNTHLENLRDEFRTGLRA